MRKFFGYIGFSNTVETSKGIWEPQPIEKPYYGDYTYTNIKNQNGDKINDDLVLDNKISIMADRFAMENIGQMLYVKTTRICGGPIDTEDHNKWKIVRVSIDYPRIIITTGGLYNG